MKKLIVAVLMAGALGTGSLPAQDTNTIAPLPHRETYAPPLPPSAQHEGSLQRGVRMGNVAQMFNPLAPAEYGSGREFVTYRNAHDQGLRPRDRSREEPMGLRLFSISF